MLRNNKDSKINSILGPEVEVNGNVKVIGSILIYGTVNGDISATGTVRTAKAKMKACEAHLATATGLPHPE